MAMAAAPPPSASTVTTASAIMSVRLPLLAASAGTGVFLRAPGPVRMCEREPALSSAEPEGRSERTEISASVTLWYGRSASANSSMDA